MIRTGDLGIHNGADDNASGTSSMIELAFLLKNRESFEQAGFTWSPNLNPIQSDKIELPEWLKQK
jgi:Zn-dependent M28 family amino/carboxypeptidase